MTNNGHKSILGKKEYDGVSDGQNTTLSAIRYVHEKANTCLILSIRVIILIERTCPQNWLVRRKPDGVWDHYQDDKESICA